MGGIVDGRYRVVERLARGGMSTVYLAVDERLDRQVALKVMHPHLAEDPVLVGRFEQEAKTAARLSHPHVVAVLDQGHTEAEDGDVLAYLVMEHVPGRTLRTVIRDRAPLSPREALRFLRPLVDGLAAAHRAGLVHRDVKPENVLVRDDGRVTVADFGLSRAATAHTMAGQAVVGTPAYLAPEHIAGAPADARSDVYAVGIILFELLTGRQPYTAATALQVAYRHVHERVPVPSTLHPGLPEDLDDLVLWCTEPDPADRPAGAGELLHRIDAVAAGLDLEMPTTGGISDAEVLRAVGTGALDPAAVTRAAGRVAQLVERVFSVERIQALQERAKERLGELKLRNVVFRWGDGWEGWPALAPYNGIIVTAAAADVPQALLDQLAPGGRLVIPVGAGEVQQLMLIIREENGFSRHLLDTVRFVPLLNGPVI